MVEEEPAAVVAFALAHFPTIVPYNQQFECAKGESAADVLKFVKRQRPGKPSFCVRETLPRSPLPRGRLHDFQRSRRVSAPRILGDEDLVDGFSQPQRLIDRLARPFRVGARLTAQAGQGHATDDRCPCGEHKQIIEGMQEVRPPATATTIDRVGKVESGMTAAQAHVGCGGGHVGTLSVSGCCNDINVFYTLRSQELFAMPLSANLLKFLVLCLVWGLTWIATKVGVGTVPPLLFAATRFIAAGVLVSLWMWREIDFSEWQKNDVIRLFAASLLMVTLTYGPLFWGMRYVSSGTAGVLEMSLTPIALLGFGIALGQERWSWVNVVAMALGIAGLCILFAPSIKADQGSSVWAVVGFVAIAWAAISYAWGSVLARPLIERFGSGMLSGSTMLIGGTALLVGSLGWEPNSTQSLEAFWGWPATLGWLFLLLFGSLVGYSLYMQLLRDLGPAKAGSFAFVSPIIAVLVGVIAAGETVSALSDAGMAVMLVAAGACLYGDELEAQLARIACNGIGTARKPCSSSALMR
jgi:drug/metabolite transporter (DMT)-like permease